MKMSPYFKELSSAYAYEMEDLTYDSGGANVLKSRLKVKRDQFQSLLAMTESFPVMVVPAFHGAFRFKSKELAERLVACKPEDFPSWESAAATLELAPWAEELATRALQSAGGDRFMLIAAGLEFILSGLGATAAAGEAEPARKEAEDGDAETDAEEDNRRDDGVEDLGDAGEDYLEQQGFDRRS